MATTRPEISIENGTFVKFALSVGGAIAGGVFWLVFNMQSDTAVIKSKVVLLEQRWDKLEALQIRVIDHDYRIRELERTPDQDHTGTAYQRGTQKAKGDSTEFGG